MKMKGLSKLITISAGMVAMLWCQGCREEEVVIPAEEESVGEVAPASKVKGFYLVNEGNMGSNKCTLDYYDYSTGVYTRNFYAERNPGVIKELGDVGNDIAIYGSRLYVVVNCSHKVEVLDAATGIRIGSVDIPNCRYIKFKGPNAYVSSYVGPAIVDPDSPLGAVYRVDTLSLTVTARATVGYQPEEMEILGDTLFVANSGGYRPPEYDHTVSAIRLSDFKELEKIPVAINLHRLRADKSGRLWVSSRGNNLDIPSNLLRLDRDNEDHAMRLSKSLNVECSNFAIKGDSLLYFASGANSLGVASSPVYGIIDISTGEIISTSFIDPSVESEIKMPYGLAIHPVTGDIFITDAKNYVSSGTLYCLDRHGRKKWSVRTGDIPAAIAFL